MVTLEGLGFPHGNKPPGKIRESQKQKGKIFLLSNSEQEGLQEGGTQNQIQRNLQNLFLIPAPTFDPSHLHPLPLLPRSTLISVTHPLTIALGFTSSTGPGRFLLLLLRIPRSHKSVVTEALASSC